MGRHDVPEQHLLVELELGEDAVDDRRRRLGRPGAGELTLGGERDAGDSRAAVAGGLADEHERRIALRVEVGGRAGARRCGRRYWLNVSPIRAAASRVYQRSQRTTSSSGRRAGGSSPSGVPSFASRRRMADGDDADDLEVLRHAEQLAQQVVLGRRRARTVRRRAPRRSPRATAASSPCRRRPTTRGRATRSPRRLLELVRLRVAVVVVGLPHRDDDVHRRARDPGLEPEPRGTLLVGQLRDPDTGRRDPRRPRSGRPG